MKRLLPYALILALGVTGVCLPYATTHEARTVTLPGGEQVAEIVTLQDKGKDVADWGHKAIDLEAAWKVTKGKGVVVAVLDTGFDFYHPDLKYRYVAGGKDFSRSRSGVWDRMGHGTHCAGIIAADENGSGVVGVAPLAKILPVKVLGDDGSGATSWIAAGIDYAVEQGAHVISMSLGGEGSHQNIHDAIKRAVAKGVIVVAAAGNSGPNNRAPDYPGAHPECVCVAAVDGQLRVARFSSRGPQVDIAAPGVDIQSTYPGGKFARMSGTSMATPYVAGMAALYVSAAMERGEKWGPEDFMKRLGETAKDIDAKGRDNASGAGLMQSVVGVKLELPVTPPPREVK